METKEENLHVLEDIRSMMERSSRFISLSGWSGISAGIFALAGAWMGWHRMGTFYPSGEGCETCLRDDLLVIALVVFIAAFVSAAVFTFMRSKANKTPVWGSAARRLLWHTLLPMAVGGILIMRMIMLKQYEFVPAASLLFYGLGLVNGSKYTMGEVRYLGYGQILTGVVALFILHAALYCWAIGFGVLHIVYGLAMWWKYERGRN